MHDAADSQETPLRIGAVTLGVHDLLAVAKFYREVLGLQDIAGDSDRADLGVDGDVLLRLVRRAANGSTGVGLFHTAFLLPGRADLGRWLVHAANLGLRLDGMSDHGVSEAVYLHDPENNGIEIYADRSRADWPRPGGVLRMTTARLRLADVTEAAGDTAWTTAPAGTRIGHVHLAVGSLEDSETFYRDVVGLERMDHRPGASFLSSGGYHHHVAVNTWHTQGMDRRAPDARGLEGYELRVSDAAIADAIRCRALAVDVRVEGSGAAFQLDDPSGIRVRVLGAN